MHYYVVCFHFVLRRKEQTMANKKKGVSSKTHTQKQLDDYANQHNPNNKAYKANQANIAKSKKHNKDYIALPVIRIRTLNDGVRGSQSFFKTAYLSHFSDFASLKNLSGFYFCSARQIRMRNCEPYTEVSKEVLNPHYLLQ